MIGAGEAKEAAERTAAVRARVSAQLSFLVAPPAPAEAPAPAKTGKAGRPAGSKNRSKSELRAWLAAQGFRMPEAQLAQLAMLDAEGDLFVAAMARAEQMIAWSGGLPKGMTRLGLAMDILRLAKGAAEAMLPYGLAKLTPDQVQNVQAVQIVMPGAGGGAGSDGAVRLGGGDPYAPPPFSHETKRNQWVEAEAGEASDGSQSDDEGKA